MMTKTYAITEEQQATWLAKLNACDLSSDDSDLITTVIDGLQSLPLITGEPVRYEYQAKSGLWFPFIDQRHYDNTVADGYPIRPLYTHPQPLQPITADDVGNELIYELWHVGLATHTGAEGKAFVTKIINAWIKHKGDTK